MRKALAASIPSVAGWTPTAQTEALSTAICVQDAFPPVGDVKLASLVPS